MIMRIHIIYFSFLKAIQLVIKQKMSLPSTKMCQIALSTSIPATNMGKSYLGKGRVQY